MSLNPSSQPNAVSQYAKMHFALVITFNVVICSKTFSKRFEMISLVIKVRF